MSEKRYFKEKVEFYKDEEGIAYYEYVDNFCTRQIYTFADRIELHRQEIGHYNHNMTDQGPDPNQFGTEYEISQSEFESVWVKGVEIPRS